MTQLDNSRIGSKFLQSKSIVDMNKLVEAAKLGDLVEVNKLIVHGADVNERYGRYTALHIAAFNENCVSAISSRG